jgi:hypothetical protein
MAGSGLELMLIVQKTISVPESNVAVKTGLVRHSPFSQSVLKLNKKQIDLK